MGKPENGNWEIGKWKPENGKGIKPKLASSISRRLGYAGQAASGPPSPT